MRKLAIAVALASVAISAPAVARDHSFYAGVEGGILSLKDTHLDYRDTTGVSLSPGLTIGNHSGFDVDAVAGYDFGLLRVEGEVGYKHATIDELQIKPIISGGRPGDVYGADGTSRSLSAMLNLLLDFGNQNGLSGYAGGGLGVADVKHSPRADTPNGLVAFSDSDSGLAWQGIVGLRYAVTPNIDLGLKYRFFNATSLRFRGVDAASGIGYDLKGRWRSHSLLATVGFNFAAPLPPAPPLPAPPPPPPPPAPATQTCPDGSVILAADTCPVPPPPPPPPAPAPERG